MWMRGGSSKGGFFLASDLPEDTAERDAFLLGIMGSPDERQIDGMGGADPLTSKIAVIKPSSLAGVDVDYLFLQVFVDRAIVTDAQNCGNILASVGPFAIERGLVAATDNETTVVIHMENSGKIAVATVQTPDGKISYEGNTRIDGVPGTAAPVALEFRDTAGSTCGALLPSGNMVDTILGVDVTLIDNGMPTVILRASDMGLDGSETRGVLNDNEELKTRLEAIRLEAGHLMNLGDVSEKTIPKMTMVSAAKNGGAIATATFIPHICHASIGVFCAVSVASACSLEGAPVAALAKVPSGVRKEMRIEHPSGETTILLNMDGDGVVKSAEVLRTARKLYDGTIFAPTTLAKDA